MSWKTYNQRIVRYPEFGFSIDLSLMDLSDSDYDMLSPKIDKAFADMAALESGAIANPDEQRMVGHYWLRNPSIAPTPEIQREITEPLESLKAFAEQVHTGVVVPPGGGTFERVLLIGIGGSALGPQLVSEALGQNAKLPLFFLDNTDPAGIDHTLGKLASLGLATTLVLVISKSGGTPETRNGMMETKAAYDAAGLDFGKHTVAITGTGSKLDQFADAHGFIARFPMEDWVGGRTSVLSTVGLVPAALQGIQIDELLSGAAAMDAETRRADVSTNASMQLAIAWYCVGNGKGEKDMVVLPYKDSLVLFSKYLQQLVMESLGKEKDLDGNTVHQGIAVYGNKGSTDQHAYIQQLRDGLNNFFATFIEVRQGRSGPSIEVEPGNTSADFLQGFLRGTRKALYESGRKSITISIPEVTPFQLGSLIALFERAVSFYASLVHINAYHQPGVEAGKKAAGVFLNLLNQVRGHLTADAKTAAEMAYETDSDPEDAYHCLVHLANNGEVQMALGDKPEDDTFQL
ncbi:glucose-6-phosphate isomerase [Luteolibacter pohnpeiensis]|uniref:Glucose-6-phosphate isomerase n=1 Tax=Luteolibacter pohnpeiensis TaxID=454153 RepID=A0A934S219_9BACT|nr:glucose-6-phosphate isomerase [Luteolibacter pohnpeiensis]MBK1880961.1 glucose-6-phosphate isomerase [Luteolibacter pohnpeiensis]